MLHYSLRQLEYFVTTAECHSVAKAARQLSVSQPSVSKAITNLEGQFSTQLFVRHHAKGVSLTRAGERLLVDARSLLRYARDLQQSFIASRLRRSYRPWFHSISASKRSNGSDPKARF